jgi:hypothetical protein
MSESEASRADPWLYPLAMLRARTMVNAGATVDQVGAIAHVVRRAGFEGECVAELGSQGGGIWMVMLDLGPKAFFGGLVGAAGVDGWRRLKVLMGELQEAFGRGRDSHVQLYLRPDAVTKAEWEASGRKVRPPGFHRSNRDQPEELVVDSLMSDDEYRVMIDRYRDTPDSEAVE